MPTAFIVIQQNDNPGRTTGSRDDLVLNTPVVLSNSNDTGVISWSWLLLDKPASSAASLSTPTQAISGFTPDVTGTYLIQLTVNGTLSSTAGAAVKTINLHMRIPAAKETDEFDAVRGWAGAVDFALQVIDDGYGNVNNNSVRLSPATVQTGYIDITGDGYFGGDVLVLEALDTFGPSTLKVGTGTRGLTTGVLIGGSSIQTTIGGSLFIDGYIDRTTPGALNIAPNTATGGTIGKGGTTGTFNWGLNGAILYSQAGTNSLAVSDANGTVITGKGSIGTSGITGTFSWGVNGFAAYSEDGLASLTLLNGATAQLTASTTSMIGVGGNQITTDANGSHIFSFGEGAAAVDVVFSDAFTNQPYVNVSGRFGVNINQFGAGQPEQSGAFASGKPTFQIAGIDANAPVASITGTSGQVSHVLDINSNGNTGGNLFSIDSVGNAITRGHLGVDGYTIDVSAGATTGQALVYNGSSFIAGTVSGSNSDVATIAALRALATPTGPTSVHLLGYYVSGDGGQGDFYWDAASTLADDGGLTIKPTAVSGAGRWLRMYPHGEVDVRWFGAIGDDTTHPLSGYFSTLGDAQAIYPHATSLTDELDWAAIQAAINAVTAAYTPAAYLSASGGGVFVSKGIYHCNQPLAMHTTIGFTLHGSGHGSVGTGNNNNGEAVIVYTVGDTRRFVDGRSSGGLTLDNLSIMYSSNSYAGRLVDVSHFNGSDTQGFTIRNCMLSGGTTVLAGTGAHSLLYMSNAISSFVDNCIFGVAVRAIFLREQDGSYANAITISNCNFVYHKYSILNADEGVQVLDCIFEGSGGVMQAAYYEEYTDVHASLPVTFVFDSVAGTITRDNGSFITDGWVTGQNVSCFELIAGVNTVTFNVALSSVTATVLTLAGVTNMVSETRTSDCKLYTNSNVQDQASPTSEATLGIQLTFDAATQSITRNNGSWIDDHVFMGQLLNIVGTASNNGTFSPVTGISPTVLSFISVTLTFASAGNTITRDNGSFINDGWTIGMAVTVAGTLSNNGTYGNVSNVTATVLTITGATFVGESSTTADIYSLFESRFQARTLASPGVVFVNEVATAGHIYQLAGAGPLSFTGCWMGDQFLPSTWFQFGGLFNLKISGCQIIGNLRVADFRQAASGITVDPATHIVTIQEPFNFQSQASLIEIRCGFGGTAADIALFPVGNPPTSVDMHTTFLPVGTTSPDLFARSAKSWLFSARDQFVVSKPGISADPSTVTAALQIVQGGNTVMTLGGFSRLGGPTGLIQGVGALHFQWVNSGPVRFGGNGFNRVGIGYGYNNADLQSDLVTSQLVVDGAIATSYRILAADGYVDDHDSFIDIDATLSNVTAILPDATTCKGREYTLKRFDNSGNTATVSSVSSQTFDGLPGPYSLASQNSTVVIVSDNINWRIKSKI